MLKALLRSMSNKELHRYFRIKLVQLLHHATTHRSHRGTCPAPEAAMTGHVAKHTRVVHECPADRHCPQLTLHLGHHVGHESAVHS